MKNDMLYDRLQQEIDLVALVKKHILLHEGRKALKGDCPLHDDNRSFILVPGKNVFKCCGSEGGPVEFFAMMNRLNKQSAIEALANKLQPQEKRSA